ncbi:MAG TPA: trehalose-phosphatase, partial [candidate division Zixibacteria bacterium]|nr:trehalose-phosphatase [candidate division Zixibacteria bacterium]
MAHGLPQDFWGKVRSAPRRLLLLDYDGTLAPFHVSRMQARPSDATRELLHEIVAAGHTKVVIVSGRPARQVKVLLDELPVEVFGAHGFERAPFSGELRKQELSNDEISGLEEAKSAAASAGLSEHIEVKPASVAIHVRGLDAQRTIEVEELAWNIYTPIAEKHSLECRAFNGGVEIRSRRFHKGLAIETLAAEEPGDPFIVYVGDDETDEDAFKALRSNGFGIKVGGHPSDTAARGYLPNQEEVLPFLRQWHQAIVSKDRIVISDRSTSRLICVSNRLPSLEVNEQGERSRPIGGLATALEAALSQSEAGGLWMGWSGNIAPERDAHKLQEFGDGPIQLMAVDLTEREHEAYYNGFCNNTIWPLFHNFPTIAKLSSWQLEVYRAVNELFAQSLIDSLKDNDLVWAHDYHLMLLAKRLRAAGWRGRTGFFLHTPFPPLDTLAVLPDFQDFLRSLLEYDLIGFQTQPYLDNYIYACRRALGAEWDGYVLRVGATHQRAGVYPIGIDTQRFVPGPQSSAKRAEGRTLTETFGDRDIII